MNSSWPGSEPGPGQIVYSNGYAVTALAKSEGAEVIDLGIVRRSRRGHHRRDPARARGRRGCAGDDRRRLGRRLRPRPEGFRRRGRVAVVLEGRAAARPAADARHPRRRCMCSACPAIRSRPSSARSCSWCRSCAASPAAADTVPETESALLGSDLPANDERADYLRATLCGAEPATPLPLQDFSMMQALARGGLPCNPGAF